MVAVAPLMITCTALKNADAMLYDVLRAVDTSGDGQIQYNGTKGPVVGNVIRYAKSSS